MKTGEPRMSMSHGPGQARWETHLDAIEREGIGTKAYAQREGLPVPSLYYWRRRLMMEEWQSAPPDGPASEPVARQFLPVEVGDGGYAAAAGSVGHCGLTRGEGLRLELPALPSRQGLAQVRQAMAERGR